MDVTLDLEAGRFYGFAGEDGCGKGLLLHLMGLLETPDSGSLALWGQQAPPTDSEKHLQIRTSQFGYLFPSPCLLPSLSVAENVAMPLFRGSNMDASHARDLTRRALKVAGIVALEGAAVWKLPEEIRHRVAFARAIAHGPKILIAVSPATAVDLLPLVASCYQQLGMTVLWSGSFKSLAPVADPVIKMTKGKVLS